MGIFANTNKPTVFDELAQSISAAVSGNQFSASENLVGQMLGFESIDADSKNQVMQTEESIEQYLRDEGFDTALAKHLGVESVDHACVVAGMNAATATMMAGHNPEAYHAQMLNPPSPREGVKVYRDHFAGQEPSMEGYDNFKFEGFIGTSVVANALAAASSPFSETFFRTIVLAPTQSGVDIKVTNPLVYTKKARSAGGAQFDLQKQSAVRALLDFSILAGHATRVLPVANGANDAVLVAAADVANRTEKVGGVEVNVRPIKYGTTVDLLAVSADNVLIKAEVQDETDTLDRAISVGRQFLKLTNGADSGVIALDTEGHRGALLQVTQEGNAKDLQTIFESELWVRSDDVTPANVGLQAALKLATVLGGVASDDWKFKLKVKLAAYVNYTNGNMEVNFHRATVGDAYLNGVKVGATEQAALVAALVAGNGIVGLGYEPKATRSNSNMRQNGTIIDMSDTVVARIPAEMQSPLTILAPTSVDHSTATMEAVNMIRRVRSSNDAVSKLLQVEAQLNATKGIEKASPAIGSLAGILPTFFTQSLDAIETVVVQGSRFAIDELRGHLSAAVSMAANKLLLDSGYLASLEMFTGTQANFEVIVGTDPQLANLLMTSGDNRTLGNGRNYVIASTQDERLRNKIYISVRRTDVDGADPHTFGAHVMMPSLVHKATVSNNRSTSQETIVVPRENFALTCPVLARIDVANLETMFTVDLNA